MPARCPLTRIERIQHSEGIAPVTESRESSDTSPAPARPGGATSERERSRATTRSIMRDASGRAVRGVRFVGSRANTAARGMARGSARAAGGIGIESGALVRDAVIGVVEGTGQVVSVTAPAIRDVVSGGVREGNAGSDDKNVSSNVVAGAIVGADSVGIDESEAVAAVVEGAVEGIVETGGDISDAAREAVGGIVSGVAETGGDVETATRDAADLLIVQAAEMERSANEIAGVATSAVEAALVETAINEEIETDVVVAAAVGAVEAAYRVDTTHGDLVRQAVLSQVAEPSAGLTPVLRSRLPSIAEQLSKELPQGRAAWRGKAIFRAVRVLHQSGGIDLAGSLAYFTILSLFPLLALGIMAAVHIGDPEGVRVQITNLLAYYFPASEDLIEEVIGGLFGGSITLGAVALVSMLIGANGLFRATDRAVNRVFGTLGSGMVQATASQIALAALLTALFLLSLCLTAVFYAALNLSDEVFPYVGLGSSIVAGLLGALSALLPAILMAVIFAFVYRQMPSAPVEWRDAAFGSLIAIGVFELAKHGFFWFIDLATNRNVVYGPIASVVVLLMWAYISGLIFLYGAALARVASELRPSSAPEGLRQVI